MIKNKLVLVIKRAAIQYVSIIIIIISLSVKTCGAYHVFRFDEVVFVALDGHPKGSTVPSFPSSVLSLITQSVVVGLMDSWSDRAAVCAFLCVCFPLLQMVAEGSIESVCQ